MSLRNKPITFAIAIGTLPVMVVGLINYISTSNNLHQNTIESQQSITVSQADKVSRFMYERYGDIQVLSNLPILANPTGTTGVTPQQKQAVLNKYIKNYGFYDSIAVADLAGNTILQTSGEPITDFGTKDYFKEVIRTQQPVVIPPRKSEFTGKYSVYVSAPVINVNTGKMIGVVRTRIPVENLDALLNSQESNSTQEQQKSIATPANTEYHLVGPDSKFFVAQETEQIGRDAKADFTSFAQWQAEKKVATAINVDQVDNTEQLVSYAPVPQLQGMPQLNWSMLLAEDTATVFAGQRQLLLNLLAGTGLTALIAGVLAVLFANRMTNTIQQIASAIASSSTEIATTVEQQERTVSQQAASVIQTTTTMDQLDASSRQSAEHAEASATGARQALVLAENGTRVVQQTMEGMTILKEKVEAIAEQILHLSEQTTQIGGISGLVGDLANQTNMLALNAAVEAARAGEHGKGFSVVAGEIRKLADQSRKSAEKINALVADIQAAINTTVMVTDEGTKTVDQGIQLAQGTAETFTGVADSINNVFINSQQISLSAKQQAVAMQQVVAAMNAINLGAQESAIGMTQVKTSTQQLQEASQNLQALV